MRSGRRTPDGWRSGHSRFPRRVLAGLSAVVLLVLVLGVGAGPNSGAEPLRLVLSSSAASSPARAVTTRTLYVRNGAWRQYLASEQVCPGGERTDLSPRRQVQAVACLLNFARERRGLPRLAVVSILNGASATKGRQILRCHRFAHNPCGGDWAASIRATGYTGSFGENLYLASGPFAAPRPAVDAWLNSAPHRRNLFRADWREQGLAVVSVRKFGGSGRVVVWVNVLGDPSA